MRLDTKKFMKAMYETDTSYRGFCDRGGISRCYIYNIIGGKAKAGNAFWVALEVFCREKGFSFLDFVIFEGERK